MRRPVALRNEGGFTLPEMIVATMIIASATVAFTLFMASIAATQRSAMLDKISDRVLTQQVEMLNALSFDNLMASPSGTYADCTLSTGRASTQAVRPGPETVSLDGLDVSVTRTITWTVSGTGVSCTSTDKDRSEPKTATVTVRWKDGTVTRSKSSSVIRSREIEQDPPPSLISAHVPSVLTTLPVNSATNWCVAGGSTNATAASDGTSVTITYSGTSGTATCGYMVAGLTAGSTYTAVVNVIVPAESTNIYLQKPGTSWGTNSGTTIATPTGTSQTLVSTWTQPTTGSYYVRITATTANLTRPANSTVYVTGATIYEVY